MELKNAIFDMDGVITDTARVHFKAWKQIFDQYLIEQANKNNLPFKPFTIDDYTQYVDGLSRSDGIRYFLHSRHILFSKETLNPAEEELVNQIASVKNKVFLELIAKEGVSVFPSTIDLIQELKQNNIKTAVISSSFNCKEILTKAEVIDLFDAIVDGKELKKSNLKGKPDPDIFLEAAKRIEATPAETMVVEDALSGIIAGKAGAFGLVIGIDRQKKWSSQFKQQGADIVVNDLSELKLGSIKEQISKYPQFAYTSLEEIKKKLINKKIIFFTDYDGTLTPIVKRPELAVLSNDVKDVLYQLQQYCPVIILSGRQLSDLENLVAINGLYYAGNHGLEIIGPSHFATKFELGTEFINDIQNANEELVSLLHTVENCLIENKCFSLTVHFRLVEEKEVPFIESMVRKVTEKHPSLAIHQGKKVFELRPKLNWNKGKALQYIRDELGFNEKEYVTIYLGDDITDEDAFEAVGEKGVSVLVSEIAKRTKAEYRLHSANDVYYFLKDILAIAVQNHPEKIDSSWILSYSEYEPEREMLREALCTLGNGYFATRGANEEAQADGIHYPGTYFAGSYNRAKSIIAEREVYNEDLVNMPNWLPVTFKIIDAKTGKADEWFNLSQVKILDYYQELNIYKGLLIRKLRIQDSAGRISLLKFTRFVSMANPHLACQQFEITSVNWTGNISIKSGIDGSIINNGVKRYQELNSKHLEPLKVKIYKNGELSLLMRTNQSHIEVGYTAFHRLHQEKTSSSIPQRTEKENESIYCFFESSLSPNQALSLEKFVTVATNKDPAGRDCLTDTKNMMKLVRKESFESLLQVHMSTWKNIWRRCDISIESEGDDQRILRLHIFHLLQTVSKNSLDLDIGVPARGLHGESYRGHIFWDELFIMPFYIYYFPEMARSLLLYRFRRLNMARLLAKQSGYNGAMYPWQSGSDGDEATQRMHLNPRSGEWMPDFSHYQRHVNAAIVYNIWRYYLITDDKRFLSDYGAEMIIEIARFWSSIALYDEDTNRYGINHVVGPDEYHERYPNSTEPGVNNNAYTNVMAVWSIERALEVLTLLTPIRCQELQEQLSLSHAEILRWQDITIKMKIPFHEDMIISQFEGYEHLADFDWVYYEQKYGNIERLDRILKAENDSPDNYKVSKQADVLMLFYLFSLEELASLFAKLGYSFNQEILLKNIFYYLKRTSHGSTLSKVVLASLARYIESDIALKFYQDVLNSDIMDLQGGTTPEGVHLGAMASCLNINLMCFAGLDIKNNYLSFEPKLPRRISKLKFNLHYRQTGLSVEVNKEKINIKLHSGNSGPLPVFVKGELKLLT